MSDFNNASYIYDQQFTFTKVGKAQRKQVWEGINKLDLSKVKTVLEVNCGTGEDAKTWSAFNKDIIATDLSKGMIEQAKIKYPELQFQVLNSLHIDQLPNTFDVIFSNFGGLNCLSPNELQTFLKKANNQLNPGGKLIMVIMGKQCLWDKTFQFLKGKWGSIHRRNTSDALSVNVDNTDVNTWYFHPKELQTFKGFTVDYIQPIGLFVPPSYLSKFFESKALLLNFLQKLDKVFSFSAAANYADHFSICLTKPKENQR